jgi:XapX domain-containing protein
MVKVTLGLVLAFLIGAGCRWLDIPAPNPPRLVGALLIVAMTLGYIGTDWLMTRGGSRRIATTAHLCGGPTGHPIARSLPRNAGQTASAEEPGQPPTRKESGGSGS